MLAPLKDRSLIEQESVASLVDENTLLRQSLRQSRQMQKRAASLAARKIVALTNEIWLCSRYVLISCRPRAEAMNSLGVTPFLNHSSSRCQAT